MTKSRSTIRIVIVEDHGLIRECLHLVFASEETFEIVGEALGWASKTDEGVVEKIPDVPRIVALRNRLIHGYDSVDPEILWDLTQGALKELKTRLDELV